VLASLRLGERVATRCEDGLLVAEYALFDPADIVLRATDPVTVREAGYMTTARDALLRLARAGVTPALAEEAALSLAPEVAVSLARGSSARAVVGRLNAHEIFDGAVFGARQQLYEGAWLDLATLSARLAIAAMSRGTSLAPVTAGTISLAASFSALIQALHLSTALAELAGTTPVHLSTGAATRERRPGERTHTRVTLDEAASLPEALRQLERLPMPIELEAGEERRQRRDLLARVRERLVPDATPRLRAHIATLEGALAPRTMQLGPMADPDLQAIERQLASGDARGVEEQLDELEGAQGRSPGIRYLRARAALLRGEEAPRSVANLLSELAREEAGFHQATLGAARTWLAAGEDAHARYYARQVTEDPAAPESERLVALEILDETAATAHSNAPPPVHRAELVPVPRMPRARAPLFPSLGDVPPPNGMPFTPTLPPAPTDGPGWYQPAQVIPPPADPGASRGRTKSPAPARYEPELAESLALPMGSTENDLAINSMPKTAFQARIAMTRLARDLARDYRLWYGKSLRCNVLAIDAMQQHLMHRFSGAPIADEGVAWELRRHGALLSEILGRALSAEWVDIGPSEPGYWAMVVPPGSRTYPIARVYRFVSLGHKARDLVSYYLDLEARSRESE
jgi:hypothetical protein